MRKGILIIASLVFCGCATTEPGILSPSTDGSAKAFTNIQKVTVGMSQAEVENLMGQSVVIGYKKDEGSGEFAPVTIAAPYRTTTLDGSDQSYEVRYYFTQVVQADGNVSDEELTPLVFEDGRVLAKGREALKRFKEQHLLK